MTALQKAETEKKYQGKFIDVWGEVDAVSENYISLRYALKGPYNQDKVVFKTHCSYGPQFREDAIKLNYKDFVCIRMEIDKIGGSAISGFYHSLNSGKASGYKKQFEDKIQRNEDETRRRSEEQKREQEILAQIANEKSIKEWKQQEAKKSRDAFVSGLFEILFRSFVCLAIIITFFLLRGEKVENIKHIHWIWFVISIIVGFFSWILSQK